MCVLTKAANSDSPLVRVADLPGRRALYSAGSNRLAVPHYDTIQYNYTVNKNTSKSFLIYSLQNLTDCNKIVYMLS